MLKSRSRSDLTVGMAGDGGSRANTHTHTTVCIPLRAAVTTVLDAHHLYDVNGDDHPRLFSQQS
jgi:hypothetical protein